MNQSNISSNWNELNAKLAGHLNDDEISEIANDIVRMGSVGRLLPEDNPSKSNFSNAVKIIKRIGPSQCHAAIPGLIMLMQDINWPGSANSLEILSQIDTDLVISHIDSAFIRAKASNDEEWIYNIREYLMPYLSLSPGDLSEASQRIIEESTADSSKDNAILLDFNSIHDAMIYANTWSMLGLRDKLESLGMAPESFITHLINRSDIYQNKICICVLIRVLAVIGDTQKTESKQAIACLIEVDPEMLYRSLEEAVMYAYEHNEKYAICFTRDELMPLLNVDAAKLCLEVRRVLSQDDLLR